MKNHSYLGYDISHNGRQFCLFSNLNNRVERKTEKELIDLLESTSNIKINGFGNLDIHPDDIRKYTIVTVCDDGVTSPIWKLVTSNTGIRIRYATEAIVYKIANKSGIRNFPSRDSGGKLDTTPYDHQTIAELMSDIGTLWGTYNSPIIEISETNTVGLRSLMEGADPETLDNYLEILVNKATAKGERNKISASILHQKDIEISCNTERILSSYPDNIVLCGEKTIFEREFAAGLGKALMRNRCMVSPKLLPCCDEATGTREIQQKPGVSWEFRGLKSELSSPKYRMSIMVTSPSREYGIDSMLAIWTISTYERSDIYGDRFEFSRLREAIQRFSRERWDITIKKVCDSIVDQMIDELKYCSASNDTLIPSSIIFNAVESSFKKHLPIK